MPIIINKKRTTLSLPADASDEQIIESIANATGIPKEKVPPLNKKEALAKIREQRTEVEAIKLPYINLLKSIEPKVQKSKYEEVDDIGRFIYAANHTPTPTSTSNFTLNIPQVPEEFPDFVLKTGNKRIGLEHTRLMDSKMKAMNVIVKHCLEETENILSNNLSQLSKTITVFFDYSKGVNGIGSLYGRNLSRTKKSQIVKIITEYVKSELTNGSVSKPDFIKLIDIIPNQESRIDVGLGESYITSFEFSSILTELINEKEERVLAYRKAVDIDFLWLLIVVDDLSEHSGFNLEGPFYPQINTSGFDCIMLFERFNMEIFVLYTKHK